MVKPGTRVVNTRARYSMRNPSPTMPTFIKLSLLLNRRTIACDHQDGSSPAREIGCGLWTYATKELSVARYVPKWGKFGDCRVRILDRSAGCQLTTGRVPPVAGSGRA